jgi:hypothetical protein
MATTSKSKALLKMGYVQFVMDVKTATTLFESMTNGNLELFDTLWVKEKNSHEPRVKMLSEDFITLSILPNETYAMGKLLHKADEAAKEAKKEGE